MSSDGGGGGGRTALNAPPYHGLVERRAVAATLHPRATGAAYASQGSAVPIHCCVPHEVRVGADALPAVYHLATHLASVAKRAATTHHYCDIFSEELLAPLGDIAYVRLDEQHAEKVFINRHRRLALVSSDGALAQWRCAPSFESANRLVAGTPIVNRDGALVSLVTARRGNHYAVSTFEGEGGYFETSAGWQTSDPPEGHCVYGDRSFPSREALRAHVASLGGPPAGQWGGAPTPVLHRGPRPRVALVGPEGRQIVHIYLANVLTTDVEYL